MINYLQSIAIKFVKASTKLLWLKMHDIVHDFAQSITKKESIAKDSDNWMESDYTNAWHLYLDSQI